MKLDVLVFASHPDDAELSCGGTICKLTDQGKRVGVIDLTRGELGTRGSAELRDLEAAEASRRMGLSVRENLGFRDGFFVQDEAHTLAIIRAVRRYQPELVLANAPQDRHADHGRASKLVRDAVFYSGLRKISTADATGGPQAAWRPRQTFFYIQDYHLNPSFVVDITPYFERKLDAVRAFSSQFYDPASQEPQTPISTDDFWHFLDGRSRVMGRMIGVTYGEGFISEQPLKVGDVMGIL